MSNYFKSDSTIVQKRFFVCTWLFCALLHYSCATVDTLPVHDTEGLEATLPFKIEGKQYLGVATVQRRSNQKIEINFGDKVAWGLFATCHRDFKIRNPRGQWTWRYIPAMYIENVGSCIMIHKQVTKKGDSHYAIINFTSGEDLTANIKCNGETRKTLGASICQARVGTEQMLWFDEPVTAYTDDSCNQVITPTGYQMVYKMSPNFCGYIFKGRSGKIHRHVSYGYQTLDLKE